MPTDFTNKGLVHTIAGAAGVTVERHAYTTEQGPLDFELYRPPHATGRCGAVVFVTGYADPGAAAMFGKPLKDWASYREWARLVAASGIIGITYLNREPGDVAALWRHLQDHAGALGIDAARIGVWAASGSVPNALGVIARERVACAALLYGYMIDVDGGTGTAEAAAMFRFALPAVTLDELPRELPLLVVRAGRDTTPGLEPALQRFLAAARTRGLAMTLIDHAEAPHSFDLVDDTQATRDVIDQVLAFLRRALI